MDVEEFIVIPLSLWNQRKSSMDKNKSTNLALDSTTAKYKSQEKEEESKPLVNELSFGDIKILTKQAFLEEKEQVFDIIKHNPRISFPQEQNIILDNNNTEVNVGHFLNILFNKINKTFENVPDIYFTILSVLKLPPTLVKNTNALKKNRGGWIPYAK